MRFYVFAPFAAIFFGAVAFFYFQWVYSKHKIIDFNKVVLYGLDDVFVPKDDEYIMLLYNSKSLALEQIKQKINNISNSDIKILAIDFYQQINNKNDKNLIPLSAGMETLLSISNLFKITKLPSFFSIKKKSDNKYTQNSKIIFLKGDNND